MLYYINNEGDPVPLPDGDFELIDGSILKVNQQKKAMKKKSYEVLIFHFEEKGAFIHNGIKEDIKELHEEEISTAKRTGAIFGIICLFALIGIISLLSSCSKCQTCKQYTREYNSNFETIDSDTSFFVVCDRKELKYYKENQQEKHQLNGKTIVIDTYCEE